MNVVQNLVLFSSLGSRFLNSINTGQLSITLITFRHRTQICYGASICGFDTNSEFQLKGNVGAHPAVVCLLIHFTAVISANLMAKTLRVRYSLKI